MDIVVPGILFVVGFLAAVMAGRTVRLRRGRPDLNKLPMEGGVVRLDLLTRGSGGSPEPEPSTASGEALPRDPSLAGEERMPPGNDGRSGRPRTRRRR